MNDHTCSACGGTGLVLNMNKPGWTPIDCLVCLGAGRISDRMPVADALADGGMLLSWASSHPMAWAWDDLVFVSYAPQYAAEALYYGMADPQDGAEYARLAARAAFRAVPGLRGE